MSSPIPPLDGSSTPSAPRPRIEIEAAAAPENEFLHLLEASPAASYRVEGDGVFTFFTQQVEQILGYPVAFWFEGGLARWIELMHPDDQGIVAEWEAQGTDDVYAWEYRMRHRDGSWVWVYDQSRVTVDPAGGAVDHGTLLDVTDRRNAELARVGIEREYRELLETAPNAFYRVAVGERRTITYMSPQIVAMLGYPTEFWVGECATDRWAELMHPGDQQVLAVWEQVDAARASWQGEYRLRHADGHDVWILDISRHAIGADGAWIEHGTLVDITERELGARRLRESFDRLTDGVWTIELDPPRVTYANPAVARMLGRDLVPESLLEERLAFLHPDDRHMAAEALSAWIASRGGEPYEQNLRFVRPDGSVRWIVESGSVVRDERGNPRALHLVTRDETETRLAEQVAHLSEVREELVQMLVHDLRGPLTGIRLGVELLARDPSLDGDARDVAGQLLAGADRLERLVDDVLATAKLEAGSPELHLTAEPLDGVVLAAVRALGSAAEARVQLSSPAWPRVWVDRELLVRVLENLIGNALKFSPLDAPVVVEWQDADHLSAVVRVRDTGSGVPDAYKAVVFDRFQVARHHDRSVRQTGLGLSFCRHALAAHGGTIWVEDNVPHGAVFAFTIPLALDNPAM